MQVVCPVCGTKNRVAPEKLRLEVACGKCGADILPAAPMALGDAAFERFIAGTELPVVVDFWAAWCGPCKSMAPNFQRVAHELPLVRFVKVDTDAAPLASSKYAIRSIPSLLVFEDGVERARIAGALPARELKAWVQAHVSSGTPP
ncbi:MAG: thioredoxin TrxC [Betaproteobacteria bacterium]